MNVINPGIQLSLAAHPPRAAGSLYQPHQLPRRHFYITFYIFSTGSWLIWNKGEESCSSCASVDSLKSFNEKGDSTGPQSWGVLEAQIIQSMLIDQRPYCNIVQVNRVDYFHHTLGCLYRLTLGIPDADVRLGASGLLMAPRWGPWWGWSGKRGLERCGFSPSLSRWDSDSFWPA